MNGTRAYKTQARLDILIMKIILLSILILTSFNNFADENICEKYNLISDKEKAIIDSSKSGHRIIGNERAYFYSSPNVNCKEKDLFLIKDDLVNAYVVYNDFTAIIYLDKKGNVLTGWIISDRLTPTGTGIGPSDESK